MRNICLKKLSHCLFYCQSTSQACASLGGVLLWPPGCGKTMLAKAAAGMNSNEITFFNVSSATIVNKWRGESEKIVHALFTLARSAKYAPSIVFLDEIDAVASVRGSRTEHEADRRLKSMLFTQIDGVVNKHQGDDLAQSVMVLATTNRPWDIDEAMRRRLEKRIYVSLPDAATREAMLYLHLSIRKQEGDNGTVGTDDVMKKLSRTLEGVPILFPWPMTWIWPLSLLPLKVTVGQIFGCCAEKPP